MGNSAIVRYSQIINLVTNFQQWKTLSFLDKLKAIPCILSKELVNFFAFEFLPLKLKIFEKMPDFTFASEVVRNTHKKTNVFWCVPAYVTGENKGLFYIKQYAVIISFEFHNCITMRSCNIYSVCNYLRCKVTFN